MRVLVGAVLVGLSLSGCILLSDWGDRPVTYWDVPCDDGVFHCEFEGWACVEGICYPPDAGIFQEAGADGEVDADGSM